MSVRHEAWFKREFRGRWTRYRHLEFSDVQNLQIDGQRLWDTLMHTAQIGATPKGGICRLTLTDLDRQVRDWFKAQCEALGCAVAVDEVGTMFARRPGKNPNLPPIAMGSHLDTQPTGGKFDGVLGVLGALEAMRTLHETGYETNAPIEIVNWTNEEGARFAPAMLASGVFAGVFSPDYAYARTDRDGKTFGDELQRIGYKGEEKAGARKFSAMFELHIEQGPILEAEGRMIGAVQGVQGIRWYEVTVTGEAAHTGTTPMPLRKNALIGAARMIERIDAIAREHAPDAVGAVGLIENKPNSRNVIPGEVFFSVDFRHPDGKNSRRHGGEIPHSAGRRNAAAAVDLHRDADLAVTPRKIRARTDRMRAHRRRESRLPIARHDLRRRPRRRLYRPRGANDDDLRALRRRHFAQRSGIDEF